MPSRKNAWNQAPVSATWALLPHDLLYLILHWAMSWGDFRADLLVCKHWTAVGRLNHRVAALWKFSCIKQLLASSAWRNSDPNSIEEVHVSRPDPWIELLSQGDNRCGLEKLERVKLLRCCWSLKESCLVNIQNLNKTGRKVALTLLISNDFTVLFNDDHLSQLGSLAHMETLFIDVEFSHFSRALKVFVSSFLQTEAGRKLRRLTLRVGRCFHADCDDWPAWQAWFAIPALHVEFEMESVELFVPWANKNSPKSVEAYLHLTDNTNIELVRLPRITVDPHVLLRKIHHKP
jgi:hypothetical protein